MGCSALIGLDGCFEEIVVTGAGSLGRDRDTEVLTVRAIADPSGKPKLVKNVPNRGRYVEKRKKCRKLNNRNDPIRRKFCAH